MKPDSGEREVRRCKICQRETFPNGGDDYQHNLCFRETTPHSRECWKLGYERLAAMTCIEPPLAQRILAALEGEAANLDILGFHTGAKNLRALAAELQEVMPK